LPTLFSGLPVTWLTAAIAFGTLVIVGILAGIYPARHASLLPPVEALRHE
jgi:ABC-type lipoprotein release transport system permease subunit